MPTSNYYTLSSDANLGCLWQNVQYWLIEHLVKPQDFSLTLPTCLGLVDNTKDILLHHALLIGRYHIY